MNIETKNFTNALEGLRTEPQFTGKERSENMKKFLSVILALSVIISAFAVFPTAAANSDEIVSFEIVRAPAKVEYREKVDSTAFKYYDETKGESLSAEIYNLSLAGMKVKIGCGDGTEKEYIYENALDLFSNITTDAAKQYAEPWGVGKHTVNVSFGKFTDHFEIEIVPTPYVKAEIISLPYLTKTYKEFGGAWDGDRFVYTPDLSGLIVRLTKADRTYDDVTYNSLTAGKFTVNTDQSAKNQWGEGAHIVEVLYGSMSVATYDFTVSHAEVSFFSIENYPTAVYYASSGTGEICPGEMTLRVLFTDGSEETVTYDDIMSGRGAGGLFTFLYDNEKGEYSVNCANGVSVRESYRISYDVVSSIEVTTPPSVFTNVENFGVIVDMTGCTVKINMKNGQVRYWTYDESLSGGRGLFYGDIFSWKVENTAIVFTYMGGPSYRYTAYKSAALSDLSTEIINKNTTVNADLDSDAYVVYTFKPWDDGEYDFSADGTAYTYAEVYSSSGYLDENMVFASNLVNGEPNVKFTLDCKEGETYYIVLHRYRVETEIGDGKVSFTVFHGLLGDATGDGRINLQDVLAIRQYMVDLIEEKEINKVNADVNGDGKINIQDVLLIRQYLAGVISDFPEK